MKTPEEKRAQQAARARAWYAAHREQELEVRAKRRRDNPEKVKADNNAYYWRHREENIAKAKQYHADHREDILAKNRV